MPLSEDDYIALVEKAEQDAENNPSGYKRKLALFAVLGYAVIFIILFLLITLVGGTVAIALVSSSLFLLLLKKKLVFLVLAAIWVFLKALWVSFSPPEGFEATKKQFPQLFKEIEQLTTTLDTLKIHQVLIDNDFNAGVVQQPRWGLFGGQKNILIIGLPLMLSLSPEQMRAVLAHEFGHLSGNHSRFSGWIYRVRITWHRVMEAFEYSDSFGAKLMQRFFNWYTPRFQAYSFALARHNEYEADQISAELTSKDTAAQALVSTHAVSPYIDEKFWSNYFKQADVQPKPPGMPYEKLSQFLKKPLAADDFHKRIKSALDIETHVSDTHPSLKDRLNALDSKNIIPKTISKNAAEAWLAEEFNTLVSYFDNNWSQQNLASWEERYAYAKEAKEALATHKDTPPEQLDDDTLWDMATWTREFGDYQQAISLYQQYISRHDAHPVAGYYIGSLLLDNEREEEALDYLKLAFQNASTVEDAAQWGYGILMRQGKKHMAEAWWNEAETAMEKHHHVYMERAQITAEDSFNKPTIDPTLRKQLRDKLLKYKFVKNVWLAEKQLKHDTQNNIKEAPVYIVAFSTKGFHLSAEKLTDKIAQSMDINAEIFVVCFSGDGKPLAKKVKKSGIQIL